MLKPKHQRLALLSFALVAVIGAGLLASIALRSQANYFYLPADIAADPPDEGRGIRLGGMVQEGSIVTRPDGVTIAFVVQDGEASVPVTYTGILPDLFVEGSGVVADGRMDAGGTFRAETLLAKHDETYMPRELEGLSAPQLREELQETVE